MHGLAVSASQDYIFGVLPDGANVFRQTTLNLTGHIRGASQGNARVICYDAVTLPQHVVWVGSYNDGRILAFDSTLPHIQKVFEFNLQSGACSGIAARGGFLYLTTDGPGVKRIDPRNTDNQPEVFLVPERGYGIAFDRIGRLYIAIKSEGRIERMDLNGVSLGTLTTDPVRPEYFALDEKNGCAYVSDASRVFKYKVDFS